MSMLSHCMSVMGEIWKVPSLLNFKAYAYNNNIDIVGRGGKAFVFNHFPNGCFKSRAGKGYEFSFAVHMHLFDLHRMIHQDNADWYVLVHSSVV